MIAVDAWGQSAVPSASSAIASRGDGGSCGHHQVTSGWRAAIKAAILRAFIDCGEERKPWR